MSERPFMQLYVSDFLGDTLELSTEGIGAYMLLLMAMWNAGGTLPDDEAKLARITRMSIKKWRAVATDILKFFGRDNGRITHQRLSKELQKSESKSQSRASAGAEGGKAKALKDKGSSVANATVLPQHLPDTRSHIEDNPLAQQPIAAAPREKVPDLVDRLAEAAGIRGNLSTGLAFPGEILGLLDAGFDLERDVLPAIRAKPNPNARGWSYFLPQIRDAVARRSAAASVPKPTAPSFNWSAALQVFRENGTWAQGWGPKPGERGCRVPPELLQKAEAA